MFRAERCREAIVDETHSSPAVAAAAAPPTLIGQGKGKGPATEYSKVVMEGLSSLSDINLKCRHTHDGIFRLPSFFFPSCLFYHLCSSAVLAVARGVDRFSVVETPWAKSRPPFFLL